MSKEEKEIKSKEEYSPDFPMFCDFSCQYAEFANPESTGACRRDISVWCKYFKKYNNKNNRCLSNPQL